MHSCESGRIGPGLRITLWWWLAVPSLSVKERLKWASGGGAVAYLFADAAGVPVGLACVRVVNAACYWTYGPPSARILERFEKRNDNQIMSLGVGDRCCPLLGNVGTLHVFKVMALCIGLSTFADPLVGKTVVLYNDTKVPRLVSVCSRCWLLWGHVTLGCQAATETGRAKCWDHSMFVHQIWTHAILNRMQLWVERAPSHDNITDDPSMECYSLMEAVGAICRKPVLAAVYDAVRPLGSLDTLASHVTRLRPQCAHVSGALRNCLCEVCLWQSILTAFALAQHAFCAHRVQRTSGSQLLLLRLILL